jgi:predicted Zn-dependent protease with MMP-like domain
MFAHQPQTLDDFEAAAQAVWDGLPGEFREVVGNLSIQIADFAGNDTLHQMGIPSPYNLLGLYHGVGLPFKSTGDLPYGPDMIFLYRLPILAFARQQGEAVAEVIRHVLIHEIGHHFGYSDADMEAIEAGA